MLAVTHADPPVPHVPDLPELRRDSRPALVLSGGGVRGAYEVGVLQGIVEVLGLGRDDVAPFSMFSGSSVGAINATFSAANAHRGDLGVARLARLWTGLKLSHHLRVDLLGVFGLPQGFPWPWRKSKPGSTVPRRSVLDAEPLEKLITEGIPWASLRANVERGDVEALFVTALHIASGRTTVFGDLAEGVRYAPTVNPRRSASLEPVSADHVLASAALPLVFPARRVGRRYYADGGLRFNTPLAPVIRAGAERILIVSLLAEARPMAEADAAERYPNPLFLAGKLLNALLLDPIVHDLHVLERFNKLLTVLDEILEPEERARIDAVVQELRGTAYRTVKTLAFRPSLDVGQLATEHIRQNLAHWKLEGPSHWLMRRIAHADAKWEAELASYLLFDGAFAARLIELGRRDAHDRTLEIRAFFEGDECQATKSSSEQAPVTIGD